MSEAFTTSTLKMTDMPLDGRNNIQVNNKILTT